MSEVASVPPAGSDGPAAQVPRARSADRCSAGCVDGGLDDLLPDLVADLPGVLDEVRDVLAPSWPAYAAFLDDERGEVLAAGTTALARITATAAHAACSDAPPAAVEPDDELAVFREIGRGQWQAGGSLTGLLAAYQAGVRAAWRRMSRTAVRRQVPAQAVALLAEAVFVLVDQLSAASTTGYVEAQSAAAADRERARAELVELLLTEGTPPRAVQAAAERAHWPLPDRAAVVLVDPDSPLAPDLLARFPARCLPVRRPDALGVVLPEPADVARRLVNDVLGGTLAVVGPIVPLTRLAASLQVAGVAARLRAVGVLTDDPLFVEDHLDAIIVHRDARLFEVLRERTLAPMADLAPDARQRLEDTLRSWLVHLGDRQAVAAELHVHRQTVRYRLEQLRGLFGDALDDPTFRAKLVLAVAWQPAPGARRLADAG